MDSRGAPYWTYAVVDVLYNGPSQCHYAASNGGYIYSQIQTRTTAYGGGARTINILKQKAIDGSMIYLKMLPPDYNNVDAQFGVGILFPASG